MTPAMENHAVDSSFHYPTPDWTALLLDGWRSSHSVSLETETDRDQTAAAAAAVSAW